MMRGERMKAPGWVTNGFVAAAILLFAAPAGAQVNPTQQTYQWLNLFGDVFEQIKQKYVEQVTDKDLIEAAVNGMLSSLDPHSTYLNADNFKDIQVDTRGEFGGLGIEVTQENGFVRVISPIFDTPAERAGLKPGDFITHLDGQAVRGLSLTEAVEKMRGPVDTDITLTIVRKGETAPFDITVTRDVIKIQSVRFRTEGNVGYVRITTFNEQTDAGLKRALRELTRQLDGKMDGVVMDLRNNPGGLLDQAITVADAFLEKGEIVSTRARNPQDASRHNARAGDLINGLPLVVLINDGSASASEIVAGALQDHRRAIVVGTRSFGKGSVQTIIPMQSAVALKLTTARYYTPSGRSIQEVGITPDIVVPQARIEDVQSVENRLSESELRGALRNEDSENTDATGDESDAAQLAAQDLAERDYQLSRALDLVRGIALYATRSGG